MNKRIVGARQEQHAVDYLTEHGYRIVERNYRCRLGEIDIIASQDNAIVFIEVKYRSSSRYGTAIEAVDYCKQNIIRQVAQYYLSSHCSGMEVPCRFDVIGFDKDQITYITNAF